MNLQARLEISTHSKKRIAKLKFGDPVTNICAGEMGLHSYFVRQKNQLVECTDKKGKFWKVTMDVIYPGHLPMDEARMLFEPVWQANYGDQQGEV